MISVYGHIWTSAFQRFTCGTLFRISYLWFMMFNDPLELLKKKILTIKDQTTQIVFCCTRIIWLHALSLPSISNIRISFFQLWNIHVCIVKFLLRVNKQLCVMLAKAMWYFKTLTVLTFIVDFYIMMFYYMNDTNKTVL